MPSHRLDPETEDLEFQAKDLFARYGIPVQRGVVVSRVEEIDGLDLRYPIVVKAQVLVGGRGKAGGIKLAQTPAEAKQHAGRTAFGRAAERALVQRPEAGGRSGHQCHRREAVHRIFVRLGHHLLAGRADRRAFADQCARGVCRR